MVNDTGELVDVFSCMVWAMGTHGYGYSQALQATRLALDPQPGINDANRGFLRDHIQLAIIIVSDKDDCSASADVALNDGLLLSILFKPGQVPPPGATWTATCRTSAYPPTPDGELAE